METRNDIPNIYAIRGKYMAAKLHNIEYLANCSAMKSIIREAAKLLYKYDGITPTRQEKQQAAKEHAKYILDGVQYSIQKRQ